LFIAKSLVIVFFMFIASSVFGMALMPKSVCRQEGAQSAFVFMTAPALGAGVWIALSIAAGIYLKYCAALLWLLLIFALIFVYVRRQYIFMLRDLKIGIFVISLLCIAALILFGIVPIEINGGYYFGSAIYDHVKLALVQSIATDGLPPHNPWLVVAGKPLAVVYYYGFHALAAQLSMLFGISAYTAEASSTAFVAVISLLLLAAFTLKLSGKYISLLFFFIVVCLNSTLNYLSNLLPSAVTHLCTNPAMGFWPIINNYVWSPQHNIAATIVVFALYLFTLLLKEEKRFERTELAIYIGLLCCAAFLTSIYAGAVACLIFAVIFLCFCVIDKNLRKDFSHNIGYICMAAFIALVLSAKFFSYLLASGIENSILGFGVLPVYKTAITGVVSFVFCWLHFYIITLSWRQGLVYTLGLVAIFVPCVLPAKNRFVQFGKIIVFGTFASIFFVHTNFYSNDFGWRVVNAGILFLAIFSSLLATKVYGVYISNKSRKVKCLAGMFLCLLAIYSVLSLPTFFNDTIGFKINYPKERVVFAKAAKAWEVVREHTDKKDIVLSNPNGFCNLCSVGLKNERYSTNIFFALFAQRYSAIGDYNFAISYSNYYSAEKVKRCFDKVVKIFEGNPAKEDADYLADTLKVNAIVVTPKDGLWISDGKLAIRYPKIIRAEYYRVYLTK